MKAFYILKPDAVLRPEVLKEYEKIIKQEKYIKNRHQYVIDSWTSLSCLLYEPINNFDNQSDLVNLKTKLLTTIKCYDYLLKNVPAFIDIFDIPEDIEILKKMEQIKIFLRKKYVINTDKNYLKFNNLTEEIIKKNLKDILIEKLDISHIKVRSHENIEIPGYNLAYLNCIHTPDPNIESVQRDLNIIENSKKLIKKIEL